MNIDDILLNWEEDCKIDTINIISECANIPVLHSKYIKEYTSSKLLLKKYQSELKEILYSKKRLYLNGISTEEYKSGKYDPKDFLEKISRTELEDKLNTDKDIISLHSKINYYEEKTSLCKFILDSINQRSFIMNNIISEKKFKNGE